MSDPVVVMLLTWGGLPERRMYAARTVEHLGAHLQHDGEIHLVIADDGSPLDHRSTLAGRAAETGTFASVFVSDSHGEGYGANFNRGTQIAHELAEYVLPIEDDWELTRPLALAPLVEALKDPRIDCIRLGYLGFLDDGGFNGRTIHAAGQTFLLLDPASPDPHVFSGNPRIETRTWERGVGLWDEGINPGATEFAVAHRPEARRGVVWPMDLIPAAPGAGSVFAHIGTVQARQDQQ